MILFIYSVISCNIMFKCVPSSMLLFLPKYFCLFSGYHSCHPTLLSELNQMVYYAFTMACFIHYTEENSAQQKKKKLLFKITLNYTDLIDRDHNYKPP